MNLIKGGNEPATKEDIRELQKTVIACSLATMLTTVRAIENQTGTIEKNMKFMEDSKRLIAAIQKDDFSGFPD